LARELLVLRGPSLRVRPVLGQQPSRVTALVQFVTTAVSGGPILCRCLTNLHKYPLVSSVLVWCKAN